MISTILLPYPNFRKSVACYSNSVLIQTIQLILANRQCHGIHRSSVGNGQREVWLFWSNWKQAFIRLGMMCAEEAKMRGIPYDHVEATRLFRAKRNKHWRKPLWAGWEPLHSSHRGALLQIGEVERICSRIIKLNKVENKSAKIKIDIVNNWLYDQGFDGLSEGDGSYTTEVHNFLDTQGAPPLGDEYPNHYAQFNWVEEPCGHTLIWPPNPESSWMATEGNRTVTFRPRPLSDTLSQPQLRRPFSQRRSLTAT